MHPINLRPACCIHNPSPHHMVNWPLARDQGNVMVRMCPDHGVGHPDPDHLAYVWWRYGEEEAARQRSHQCCGDCAAPSTKEELEHVQ